MPETPDFDTIKADLFEHLAHKLQLIADLSAGARLVTVGGPQGMRDVVNEDGGADMIIEAINGIVDLLQQTQTEAAKYADLWVSSVEEVTELRLKLENITKQIPK